MNNYSYNYFPLQNPPPGQLPRQVPHQQQYQTQVQTQPMGVQREVPRQLPQQYPQHQQQYVYNSPDSYGTGFPFEDRTQMVAVQENECPLKERLARLCATYLRGRWEEFVTAADQARHNHASNILVDYYGNPLQDQFSQTVPGFEAIQLKSIKPLNKVSTGRKVYRVRLPSPSTTSRNGTGPVDRLRYHHNAGYMQQQHDTGSFGSDSYYGSNSGSSGSADQSPYSTSTSLDSEPTEVIVRLESSAGRKRSTVSRSADSGGAAGNSHKEAIIVSWLASRDLHPKIYGMWQDGRIEEVLRGACPLDHSDLFNVDLTRKVATVLGQLHSQPVPIARNSNWLFNSLDQLFNLYAAYRGHINLQSVPRQVHPLLKADLEQEISWLKTYLVGTKSPIVFSHNDLNTGKIFKIPPGSRSGSANLQLQKRSKVSFKLDPKLKPTLPTKVQAMPLGQQKYLTHKQAQKDLQRIQNLQKDQNDQQKDQDQDFDVMIVDYEYAGYNYRGFDLATFLSERVFNYDTARYPFFNVDFNAFPSQAERLQFIKHYRAACQRAASAASSGLGQGLGPGHGPEFRAENFRDEDLLHEINAFSLAGHMLNLLWVLQRAVQASLDPKQGQQQNHNQQTGRMFGFWEHAHARYDAYQQLKMFMQMYRAN